LANLFALLCLFSGPGPGATAQTLTTIHSFDFFDGSNPLAGLTWDGGLLYGTTEVISNGSGNVFMIDTNTASYSLTSLTDFPEGAAGVDPAAGLELASDGNLYGTTQNGAGNGVGDTTIAGTVFGFNPSSNTFAHVWSFPEEDNGAEPDGAGPSAGLVQARDGYLYGVAVNGGTYNLGTVFRVSPTSPSTLTPLHSFSDDTTNLTLYDGADPYGTLVQGPDGELYGTTKGSGDNSLGTVFKISTNAPYTLTTLHMFSESDGNWPVAGLVLASDGNYYGVTWQGGTNAGINGAEGNGGTVFRITPAGVFSVLYQFGYIDDSFGTNLDGAQPGAALFQGSDGYLYGTTEFGGEYFDGTIFRISTNGFFTSLYTFGSHGVNSAGNSVDGLQPAGALVQGSDGYFYGTTSGGGMNQNGQVIGDGTIFKLSAPPVATFSKLSANPASAAYGSTVTLKGTVSGLSGVSGAAPVYPAQGETITVIINGQVQTTTISDATGDFSLTLSLSNTPASAVPSPITYLYGDYPGTPGGNRLLSATPNQTYIFYGGDGNIGPGYDQSTTLTITPAPVTVTADNQTKTYGQTVTFGSGSTQFTAAGLQNGDTIGSVTLADPTNGGAATAPVGTYPIVPSQASGGTFNTSNYSITYSNGTLTVTQALMTVTANNQTKTNGQTLVFGNASTQFTVTGLHNGDTIGTVILSDPNNGGAAPAPVGTYPLVPSQASGGTFNPGNYTITYVNGTLTVSESGPIAFIPGNYYGLYYVTANVNARNSGKISVSLLESGAFSGHLINGTRRSGFSGQFNPDTGSATVTATDPTSSSISVSLSLQVEMTPGQAAISGTATIGGVIGQLTAYPAGPNPLSPAQGTRRYNLVMPGATNQADGPQGYSWMTASLNHQGILTLAAVLADHTKLSQSMQILENGYYPVYMTFDYGQGVFAGWLQFTQSTVSSGLMVWSKPSGRPEYPGGFTILTNATGYAYSPPAPGQSALNLPNGTGQFVVAGVNPGVTVITNLTLSANGRKLSSPTNELEINIQDATGVFNGSFVAPAIGRKVSVSGVVLQGVEQALGWCMFEDQSGSVVIQQSEP
jgi:uncharacterized repeat protein (TIGR03803 family)